MTDANFIRNEICRTVCDIVDGLTSELERAVEDKEILDTEDLDQYLWEMIDSHEWVIYTFKAGLIAAVADWGEFIEEHGHSAISPEMLAFFHLIEETRNSVEYQELWEKVNNGDDEEEEDE